MNNAVLGVLFFIGTALIGIALGVVINTVAEPPFEYDYKVNLDYNKIEIQREGESDVITIHPDSLNAFIIKDNL